MFWLIFTKIADYNTSGILLWAVAWCVQVASGLTMREDARKEGLL